MQQQRRAAADAVTAPMRAAPETARVPPGLVSRRWLLRGLPGAVLGGAALVGLSGCGGEDDEEEEDD